jgi:hypothetical protein
MFPVFQSLFPECSQSKCHVVFVLPLFRLAAAYPYRNKNSYPFL